MKGGYVSPQLTVMGALRDVTATRSGGFGYSRSSHQSEGHNSHGHSFWHHFKLKF
ncbi:MAG: hypothetical protein KC643_27685 [Nitrospira sp.]|nr:hypothetical protein [Nitrospira sp.]